MILLRRRQETEQNSRGRLPLATSSIPQEISRKDFQHFLLQRLMRGNYLAPVDPYTRNILDIGTGTGRWAIEMARAFPRAQVIGIDQQEIIWPGDKPRNYIFTEGNIVEGLPFGNESFSFVHQRGMSMTIPAFNWQGVLREIARVTEPGGWIELVETDFTIFPQGQFTREWLSWLRKSYDIYGIDHEVIQYLPQIMGEAGFRNICLFHTDVPLGAWAGRIGIIGEANLRAFNASMKHHYRSKGITSEQMEDIWTRLIVEWNNRQAQQRFYVVCGQK